MKQRDYYAELFIFLSCYVTEHVIFSAVCGINTNSLFQRTVIWRVVQNLLPGKTKDQSSGESTPSGIMWSFAAGSNLSTSASFNAEKESRKNLNKFYKEIRTLKNVNMAGN